AGRGCGLGPGLRQADRGGRAGAIPGQPAARLAGVFSGGIVTMMVKTTYLQMFARPERVVPPPREGLTVVHARKPTVAYYRYRYDAVGRDYDWTSRKKLSDAELAALLNDPRLEVHVLMAEGVPAGFAELDRHKLAKSMWTGEHRQGEKEKLRKVRGRYGLTPERPAPRTPMMCGRFAFFSDPDRLGDYFD